MGRTYGDGHVELTPTALPDTTLADIGRLVRACAEIEDIVDLFISNLAEISEIRMAILLGKTAITRRITIAEQLAATRKDAASKVCSALFDEPYRDAIDCRNAVAHGSLLGSCPSGLFYFLTSHLGGSSEQTTSRQVFAYAPHAIAEHAITAVHLVEKFEQLAKVGASRAERLQQPLAPHPKAQRRRNAKP